MAYYPHLYPPNMVVRVQRYSTFPMCAPRLRICCLRRTAFACLATDRLAALRAALSLLFRSCATSRLLHDASKRHWSRANARRAAIAGGLVERWHTILDWLSGKQHGCCRAGRRARWRRAGRRRVGTRVWRRWSGSSERAHQPKAGTARQACRHSAGGPRLDRCGHLRPHRQT